MSPVFEPKKRRGTPFEEVLRKMREEPIEFVAPDQVKPVDLACKENCEICGGLGYIHQDLPLYHPEFGRLLPCPNAPVASSVYDYTGLAPAERGYTWAEIVPHHNVGEAVKAVKQVMERGRGIVFLSGSYGLAKSLILKIAVAEATRQGKRATYQQMAQVLDQYRRSFDEDRPSAALRETEEHYKRFPLLSLDEIGVGDTTDWAVEKQFFLFDARYVAAIERSESLVTLLASNLALNQLPPRIADRLTDGRVSFITLKGDSFRPGME